MKKTILKQSICIDEIETIINKKEEWEIINKKYDFYQPYTSTFDGLNYEAKVDLYIAFKTKTNFLHKMYCYFLDFNSDNIFKISEIKSNEHPKGQMTTRIADFKYYKTTGNLGFSAYHSPINGQEYNLSHNYHSFFNSLIIKDKPHELSYVCILLKYDNHAQSKKQLRYYVNSYQKFIKLFLTKIEKFEKRKTQLLVKQETKALIKTRKVEANLTKKQNEKTKIGTINKNTKVKKIKLESEISNNKILVQNTEM